MELLVVIFSFLKNCQLSIVAETLQNSHGQCISVTISPYPLSTLVTVFLIKAILADVRCTSLWFWFASPLMAHDVEHLFMCLLVICIYHLEKYLFKSFVHFKIGLLVFYCWVVLHILSILNPYQIWFSNIFSNSVHCTLSSLLDDVLWSIKV